MHIFKTSDYWEILRDKRNAMMTSHPLHLIRKLSHKKRDWMLANPVSFLLSKSSFVALPTLD